MESAAPTMLQARSALAHRLAERSRGRLVDIIKPSWRPYEPAASEELVLIVVLKNDTYEREAAREEAIGVASDFEADTDYRYPNTVFVISEREFAEGETGAARAARSGGDLL